MHRNVKAPSNFMTVSALKSDLARCTLCADRFAATHTAHSPRPIVWFNKSARILIAGQAPGMRVHKTGKPFFDPSGDRLRDWMGVDDETFYDKAKVAIVPMAFCFPGYDAKGSDLPPPKICAQTWQDRVTENLSGVQLTLLIGGYAQAWHLKQPASRGVTQTVAGWRDTMPVAIPLPHPSWRNTSWIKKNPWFETDLLPVLKASVRKALE